MHQWTPDLQQQQQQLMLLNCACCGEGQTGRHNGSDSHERGLRSIVKQVIAGPSQRVVCSSLEHMQIPTQTPTTATRCRMVLAQGNGGRLR